MQRINVDGWILLSCLIQLFYGVTYVGISKLFVSLALKIVLIFANSDPNEILHSTLFVNTVVLRLGGFIPNYQPFEL